MPLRSRTVPLAPLLTVALAALLAASTATGCARRPLPDWPAELALDELAAEVRARPGELAPLLRQAAVLEGWIVAGAEEVWSLQLHERARRTASALGAHATARPDEAGRARAARGRLLLLLGLPVLGEGELRASLSTGQTLEGLRPLVRHLVAEGRRAEVGAACGEVRQQVSHPANVLAILEACAEGDPRASWAEEGDLDLWRRAQADRQYRESFAHEVRWADAERLREAYGVESGRVLDGDDAD